MRKNINSRNTNKEQSSSNQFFDAYYHKRLLTPTKRIYFEVNDKINLPPKQKIKVQKT